jgi:hypothetical protein
MRYIIAILLTLTLFLTGCAECTKLATRCLDNQAQLCNTRGKWEVVMDCTKLKRKAVDPDWVCRTMQDGMCTCMPGAKAAR